MNKYKRALNKIGDTLTYYMVRKDLNQLPSVNEIYDSMDTLRELVDKEKQETKQETNFEHYFEHLSKLNMGDFALIDGRFTKCPDIICSECDFNGDCIEGKFKWLKQPYKKLPYKLSQWEYDLLNAYKNSGMRQCISNYGTLLEMYGKGHFKGIDTITPIREILDNCKVV